MRSHRAKANMTVDGSDSLPKEDSFQKFHLKSATELNQWKMKNFVCPASAEGKGWLLAASQKVKWTHRRGLTWRRCISSQKNNQHHLWVIFIMDLLKCPDKTKCSNGGWKPNTLTGEMHQLAGGKNLLLELERQNSTTLGKNSRCICKLNMQIQHLHLTGLCHLRCHWVV